jgi:O-antigen ligase
VGLLGAVAAIVQRAVDPTRLYGLWLPLDAGARPFGPFVNRNHFATWLLMAVPLTAGAVAAMGLGRRAPGLAADVAAGVRALGSRRGWAMVSMGTMLVALVLSFSRSAFAGAVAGLVVWCLLGYQRASRRGLLATVAAAIVLASLVVWTAPAQPILARVRETLSLGAAGRTAIWADAQSVSRAFLLTGTGLGTFERSMLIYQTTDRRTRTNQAHNQYLQLMAEGGALVTIPCGLVSLAFLWLASRRLREDSSPAAWLRIGSLAGLAGVAVQGAWETGLRMPANGILLAVVAALAVHRPARPPYYREPTTENRQPTTDNRSRASSAREPLRLRTLARGAARPGQPRPAAGWHRVRQTPP